MRPLKVATADRVIVLVMLNRFSDFLDGRARKIRSSLMAFVNIVTGKTTSNPRAWWALLKSFRVILYLSRTAGRLVVGIGQSVAISLGETIPGVAGIPALLWQWINFAVHAALWCWLRGHDRGDLLHASTKVVEAVGSSILS
jgi:hypothetical protein